MSSKSGDAPTGRARKRAWSITLRLVFLYTATAAGILLFSSLFLYEKLTNNLDRESNQFLADEIDTLRAIQRDHPEPLDALREEVESESDSRHYSHYYARIMDGREVLIESSSMAQLLPASAFPAPTRVSDDPAQGVPYTTGDGKRFLLMAAGAQVGAGEGRPRVMQLAVDTSSREAIARDYRRDMVMVVALGTLLSTAAGGLIAWRGMRPLREITRHAGRVTASQLHERIGIAHWPDELTELATAFDGMLERLERSFTRLSQLSADLAHELRTPINNLMGEAEVALSRPRSAAEHRQVIESSLEEFGRLSRMIDSLLFLARAENIESPIQPAELEARAELEAVREFYDALAEEHGVRVSCHGGATLRADPILFRRAISNLLSNALRHTPAGGEVRMRAEQGENGQVEVRVEDTGCGLAEEHLPRVFDRFYRVDQARSGYPQGTGLGLSLVQSIVDLHRGAVAIESAPGRGTTVTLRFPSPRP